MAIEEAQHDLPARPPPQQPRISPSIPPATSTSVLLPSRTENPRRSEARRIISVAANRSSALTDNRSLRKDRSVRRCGRDRRRASSRRRWALTHLKQHDAVDSEQARRSLHDSTKGPQAVRPAIEGSARLPDFRSQAGRCPRSAHKADYSTTWRCGVYRGIVVPLVASGAAPAAAPRRRDGNATMNGDLVFRDTGGRAAADRGAAGAAASPGDGLVVGSTGRFYVGRAGDAPAPWQTASTAGRSVERATACNARSPLAGKPEGPSSRQRHRR